MKAIDLTGLRFGSITVKKRMLNDSHGSTRFMCLCDCGTLKAILGSSLRSGKQISCGCMGRKNRIESVLKHGESKSHIYLVWKEMRGRCNRKTHKRYKDYGARGITVCDRWDDYLTFKNDMGDRPYGYTIERIDNNKGYSPENCKWATYSEQNKNKRV